MTRCFNFINYKQSRVQVPFIHDRELVKEHQACMLMEAGKDASTAMNVLMMEADDSGDRWHRAAQERQPICIGRNSAVVTKYENNKLKSSKVEIQLQLGSTACTVQNGGLIKTDRNSTLKGKMSHMRRSWEIERIATKQRELDVTENPEMDEATRQEAMRRIEQERHQADQ